MNVSDIREEFVIKYQKDDFELDKTGANVVEIINAQFEANENCIFGTPNEDYINRELKWYKSQSLNVNDIENTPKIWKDCADPSGYVNSNYGWCIYSKENGKQYNNCLKELRRNASTRRATMIYNRPEMWVDYNKYGRSDFMCTYAVQFFIRNDVLIASVSMRSNDAVFGYNNDYAWHKYVLDKVAWDLKIEDTQMIWNAGSIHVYERHFKFIEGYMTDNGISMFQVTWSPIVGAS